MADDTAAPADFPVVVRMDGTIFVAAEVVRAAGFAPETPLRLEARRDERDFRALLEAKIANSDLTEQEEDEIMESAVAAVRKVRHDRARRGETGSGAT